MLLVPYFAISYAKNAKAFQSILKQSLINITNNFFERITPLMFMGKSLPFALFLFRGEGVGKYFTHSLAPIL